MIKKEKPKEFNIYPHPEIRILVLDGTIKCWNYHIKHPDFIAGTVCLIRDHGVFHRGVSICSPRDQFRKRTGTMKAQARAFQAYLGKRVQFKQFNESINNFNWAASVTGYELDDPYLAEADVKLTSFEKELVKEKDER
jgi:hypothetical protein